MNNNLFKDLEFKSEGDREAIKTPLEHFFYLCLINKVFDKIADNIAINFQMEEDDRPRCCENYFPSTGLIKQCVEDEFYALFKENKQELEKVFEYVNRS